MNRRFSLIKTVGILPLTLTVLCSCGGGNTGSSSSTANSSSSVVSSSVVSSASSSDASVLHATCPSTDSNAFGMVPRSVPGKIEAEDFDPDGVSDSSDANEGGEYRTDTAVDIKLAGDGYAVGWMTSGEYLEYTINVAREGDYDVTIRSGAVESGRTLSLSQCNNVLVESFNVPRVADWGELKTLSAGKIHLTPGEQKIRISVGANDYLDLDWVYIGTYDGPIDTPEDPTVAGSSDGCGSARSLQNGRININVDNTNRSYILRVPDNYDNQKPYRLVMAYHWLNGNAQQVASGGNGGSTDDPFYGLWDLANNSTIFVAPEGIDSGWANTGGRDLRLTDAILAKVQDDLCIDTSRIFATGFSYGGAMSNALACARPDVFRGVALYSGAQLSGCDGGNSPVPFFATHGIGDSVLNVSQGRSVRDRFVRNNGCSAMSPQEPSRGSGSHICTSYQGCSEGYPVRWCAFDGDHNPTQKEGGQSKSWIPGEAWSFISQF